MTLLTRKAAIATLMAGLAVAALTGCNRGTTTAGEQPAGDREVARQWLANKNTALGGEPIQLLQTISGLVNVIQYLDARRAVV